MTDVRTGYCAGVVVTLLSVRVYTGWSAHAADRPVHGAQSPASLVSYTASVAERASHVLSEESELLRELLQREVAYAEYKQ